MGYTLALHEPPHMKYYDMNFFLGYNVEAGAYHSIFPELTKRHQDLIKLQEELRESSKSCDYWIHPDKHKDDLRDRHKSKFGEFWRIEEEIYKDFIPHRQPGVFWKKPGHYVAATNPECKFISDGVSSSIGSRLAIWDGDYVTEIYDPDNNLYLNKKGKKLITHKIDQLMIEGRIKKFLQDWRSKNADASE